MCGIAGIFGPGAASRVHWVQNLTSGLAHRGPDGGGIWSAPDELAVLGHRRLAIIDLSEAGRQPMCSASGRFAATFNGEIYNFLDLRGALLALGHSFRGTSDTEVMLAAFEQWGVINAIPRLNGMFAIAVYDKKERMLYIFRDRLGLKPLYYQWSHGLFSFSSELSPSFAALSERKICPKGLALYFRYNYIPAPWTIYQGVSKLKPGTIAAINVSCLLAKKFAFEHLYWDAVGLANQQSISRDDSMTLKEATDKVDDGLRKSVSQRMISDVPIGAFLSGGIDSSLIVAQMQKLSPRPVRTFTIGFSEAERNEANHARRVAAHFGTDHNELLVTERDALEVIPKIAGIYGEPFADSSQIPTFLVSKMTRQQVTVALSGDGGDELFGGYRSYEVLERVRGRASLLPQWAYPGMAQALRCKPIRTLLKRNSGDQRYDWAFNALRLFSGRFESWIPSRKLASHSLSERLLVAVDPGASIAPFPLCRGNITEAKMCDDLMMYLPDDILTKVDRASMAVSLEVRAPFVDDHDLFTIAWSIPHRHKVSPSGGKRVLKELLSRYLPRSLFERPKMGFAIPLPEWLNGPLYTWVQECIDPERIRREGYLAPDIVAAIASEVRNRPTEWCAYKLWAICIFQSWLQDVHSNQLSANMQMAAPRC